MDLVLPARLNARGYSNVVATVAAWAAGVLVVIVVIGMTDRLATRPLALVLAAMIGAFVPLWFVLTTRTFEALCVLVLYVACLDGFLKLKFGYGSITALRDVLMGALLLGVVLRGLQQGRKVALPAVSLLVVAWVVIVLVNVLNPGTASIKHGVYALRQHIEFVPLFFIAFMTINSPARIRSFLIVLVIAGAANGAVTIYQSTLSAQEIASWGPGYEEKYLGTDQLTPRTFNAEGEDGNRIRPPGLGSDAGAGAAWSGIGIIALLALLRLPRTGRLGPLVILGFVVLLAGLLAGQSRLALLSTIAAVVVTTLVFTSRGGAWKSALGVVSAGLAAYVVVFAISTISGAGSFARYESISPSNLVETVTARGTLVDVPKYALTYPLGAGLGVVGPAAGATPEGGARSSQLQLNAEGQYVFLVDELGIPGLVALLAVMVGFIRLAIALRVETRSDLLPLNAGIFGLLTLLLIGTWAGSFSGVPPGSIMFWTLGGILAAQVATLRTGSVGQGRPLSPGPAARQPAAAVT